MKSTQMAVLGCLVLAAFALQGCGSGKNPRPALEPPTSNKPKGNRPEDDPLRPTAGMLNSFQYRPAYSKVTGIPANDAAVAAVFERGKNSLPLSGLGSGGFTDASLNALLNLAIAYCNRWTVTGASTVYQGVDFTQPPSALSAALRDQVTDRIAEAVMSRKPSTSERTAIRECMTQTEAAVANDNNVPVADKTRDVLLCPCTGYLTSPDFITI